MTKATELAQLGGLVDVTGTGNATKVGIGTTVDITGGLAINGSQVISRTGVWQGSTAGLQGTQGTSGAQGTSGVQGTTGAQGATGTQGTQGATGTQGTTGTQGVQGITGPVAGSANQIVYKNTSNTVSGDAGFTFNDSTNVIQVGNQHRFGVGDFTTAQRDALTSVSSGTIIYNTTTTSLEAYGPAGWSQVKNLNLPGSIDNPASSPKAIRDAGITTPGLYYINTGGLGTKQVYLTFDAFGGGSIGGTVAWALVSRFDSYSYGSYNTYGWLDSIETTNFGTNSTKNWWVDQNVGNRGWMNSINYVCYQDETTGYYVTESQSGTIWQTSFIHTTSTGYPNNNFVTVNYNSYSSNNQVGCCWCESVGCTEHFDSNSQCSGTDVVRFDNHSGTSTVSIWVAQI